MSEIDKLLAQLKEEYNQVPPPRHTGKPENSPLPTTPKSSSSIDNLLAEVQTELETPISHSPKFPHYSSQNPTVFSSLKEETVLQEIQLEYQEREKAEQQHLQEQLREQKRQEEQRQRKKQELLKQKAKDWLKQLNPKSEEGKWFAEFSCSYDSPLQAAMDYLEALRETGSH